MKQNRISLIIIVVLILYANTAEAFLGALISGAVAVAKMAAKTAIKAATDATKKAIKDSIQKKREEARAKKREEEMKKKKKEKEKKVSKGKRARNNNQFPDEPSDLDDYDLELMEGIVEYKTRHPPSPYLDGDALYPRINKIKQKEVRHVFRNLNVQ